MTGKGTELLLLLRILPRHNWSMDPDIGSREAKASSAAQGASVKAQLGDQVMLAEYSALRSDVDRRVNLQWNVVALQVTSAGVIASLAISRAAGIALLLVIPLLSYMLGQRYILHDYYISLISIYSRFPIGTARGSPSVGKLEIGTGGIRPTAGPLACRDRQVAAASSHPGLRRVP